MLQTSGFEVWGSNVYQVTQPITVCKVMELRGGGKYIQGGGERRADNARGRGGAQRAER